MAHHAAIRRPIPHGSLLPGPTATRTLAIGRILF
jgi:hypothetical protein